jgi:hypothetical protein
MHIIMVTSKLSTLDWAQVSLYNIMRVVSIVRM